MREGPPDHVLASAASWLVLVQSSLGDAVLAEAVPVAGGVWAVDGTGQVPEAIQGLIVPASDRGYSWIPGDDAAHPLARYGQVLDLAVRIGSAGGRFTWDVPLGRAFIQSWSASDPGVVTVEAAGPLQLAADDRLPTPTAPATGGTLASEFRRLMPAGIPVDISPGLIDRPCPASFYWEEDRLAALYDIADAWPAQLTVTADGGVALLPPLPEVFPGALLTFTDGEGGTTVSAAREDTRDGAYNAVVARAEPEDAEETAPVIQAEARVETGPMVPATYGVVRRFYASPALTTAAQCESAARSILAEAVRPARSVEVTCVPDPRIELYDPVAVVRDGVKHEGWVTAYTLPLTVSGGDMSITVALGAG